MSVSIVKQYSVFLANEPGSLRAFASLFAKEKVTLLAVSSDVRFDAAVVRVAINHQEEIGHTLTKHGLTNVKVDAICIETTDRIGIVEDVGRIMEEKNLNITSIYGGSAQPGQVRFIIVVNDLAQAVNALEASGLF